MSFGYRAEHIIEYEDGTALLDLHRLREDSLLRLRRRYYALLMNDPEILTEFTEEYVLPECRIPLESLPAKDSEDAQHTTPPLMLKR